MVDLQHALKLRDIHLPDPVGMWPVAPGWYVIALTLLLLIGYLIYFVYLRHRRGRAKYQALMMLVEYERQFAAGSEASVISAKISELLRRVALVYYPRASVAGLNGQSWIDFLNESGKANFNDIRSLMLDLPYQKQTGRMDLKPLFSTAKDWIKPRGVPCLN